MKSSRSLLAVSTLFFVALPLFSEPVKLPPPSMTGKTAVEAALQARRSIRAYEAVPMTLAELSQLIWAAQGMTDAKGHRTAASARATYPLEVYVVAMKVQGLGAGIYHYRPQGHTLDPLVAGDRRAPLLGAARQQSIEQAPAVFVITAVPSRTTGGRTDARGEGFVWLEAGAAAENLALEAVALNLGTCFVGGFDPAGIRKLLSLAENEMPMIVLPAGRPKR